MNAIAWDRNSVVLQVAADRSFDSVLRRMRNLSAKWIVVVRAKSNGEVYYYAFQSGELEHIARNMRTGGVSLERAMEMHEWTSSGTARRGRELGPQAGHAGPAATRIVELDTSGRVTGIGERESATMGAPPEIELGPMRGGPTRSRGIRPGAPPPRSGSRSFPGATPAADVEVTLSAEVAAEVDVNATTRVSYQIELSAEALPLSRATTATAKAGVPITVSLTAENDAVEIVRGNQVKVDPPLAGQARSGFFALKGLRPGPSRLAVSFRQGGSELGVIGLIVEVVQAGAVATPARAEVTAAPRELADDDKLALLIEQRVDGAQVFYEYTLHSEALGLAYRRLRSKPLLDRGGGPAATAIAFVERIYERVTQELKSRDDLVQLQREAKGLGASLCQELLDPEVARVLWPLRAQIKLIQIVSWEPYIPWELVRLRDPDSGDIDERFLCEYGLVRTLSDLAPARTLALKDWRYLGAQFPSQSLPSVGAELEYFTSASPDSLQGHGIQAAQIPGTRDAFYDAIAAGDFDVLHLACHAESPQQSIDRASLIFGDEVLSGESQPRLVEVDTITVQAEARLKQRRPLVFLNACETGRTGAVLTAWGGWPNVFLRGGAGAFVGSAWAVRDKPAATFSKVFYNTLIDGKTLAEAASAARAAAKKLGDASWLAFKVYGHPRARRAQA